MIIGIEVLKPKYGAHFFIFSKQTYYTIFLTIFLIKNKNTYFGTKLNYFLTLFKP